MVAKADSLIYSGYVCINEKPSSIKSKVANFPHTCTRTQCRLSRLGSRAKIPLHFAEIEQRREKWAILLEYRIYIHRGQFQPRRL